MAGRLAVVGSRDYPRLDLVDAFVGRLKLDTVVVSGGARGVDRRAEWAAKRRGMAVSIFEADWSRGKMAGLERNARIVFSASGLVAFHDGCSRGTAHAVDLAARTGLWLRVYGPGGEILRQQPGNVLGHPGGSTSGCQNGSLMSDKVYKISEQCREVFCDGGVAVENPSRFGGSWAWCAVDGGAVIAENSGMVTPLVLGAPAVSNNLTELLAAVEVSEALPDGWDGTLYTDSQVTKFRLEGSKKFAGIPQALIDRCVAARLRLRFRVVLLGGHPTRKELEAGRREDGTPVSAWNVRCDRQCSLLCATLKPIAEKKKAKRLRRPAG